MRSAAENHDVTAHLVRGAQGHLYIVIDSDFERIIWDVALPVGFEMHTNLSDKLTIHAAMRPSVLN